MEHFEVSKFLGTWYELIHYPSWFQRNDNYNTMAEYILDNDQIVVRNSTLSNGRLVESFGHATYYGDNNFDVSFSPSEMQRLAQNPAFDSPPIDASVIPEYNYVVDHVWTNADGDYMYAVITDSDHSTLYVLSRVPNPPLHVYNRIMNYVTANYDSDRLVQTPHFDR